MSHSDDLCIISIYFDSKVTSLYPIRFRALARSDKNQYFKHLFLLSTRNVNFKYFSHNFILFTKAYDFYQHNQKNEIEKYSF